MTDKNPAPNFIRHAVRYALVLACITGSLISVPADAQKRTKDIPDTIRGINGQEIPRFFSTLPDVPLMPGLEESEEYSLLYDKPEGGIVEAVAFYERIDKKDIRYFYKAILPEFGWNPSDEPNQYYREGEFLALSFGRINEKPVVKFLLKPTR